PSVGRRAAGGWSAGDGGSDSGRSDAATDSSSPDGPPFDAPPLPALCKVVQTGTSGVVLTGRLLLPAGPTTGELFIAGTGAIACAAASCAATSGYASAT